MKLSCSGLVWQVLPVARRTQIGHCDPLELVNQKQSNRSDWLRKGLLHSRPASSMRQNYSESMQSELGSILHGSPTSRHSARPSRWYSLKNEHHYLTPQSVLRSVHLQTSIWSDWHHFQQVAWLSQDGSDLIWCMRSAEETSLTHLESLRFQRSMGGP